MGMIIKAVKLLRNKEPADFIRSAALFSELQNNNCTGTLPHNGKFTLSL